MNMIRTPNQLTSMLLCLLCAYGCTSGASQNEVEISRLTCKPKAQLEQNLTYAKELAEHYCTTSLSELAPKKPDGVADLVTIENTYPALPNYAAYPDIDPLQGSARRLALLAKCVHKKCMSAVSNKKIVCSGTNDSACADPKGTYFADALVEAAHGCKLPQYYIRRMVDSFRNAYEKKEGKKLEVCSSKMTNDYPHLAMHLGQSYDECSLDNNGCDEGKHCSAFPGGNRCLESPREEDMDKVTPIGQPCTTSRACTPGSSCFAQLGNAPTCARSCTNDTGCDVGEVCSLSPERSGFCQATCTEEEAKTGACVSDGKRLLKLQTTAEQLATLVPKKAGPVVTVAELNAALAASKSATCGNGKIEYPETCDSGANNGITNYGGWCSKDCQMAECGDSVLDPGEQCECDISWLDKFLSNERLQLTYRTPMNCPPRYAVTDGSEKAMSFGCHQCRLLHNKSGRDDRTNEHFLPEKDFGAEFKKPGGGVTQTEQAENTAEENIPVAVPPALEAGQPAAAPKGDAPAAAPAAAPAK